MLNPAPFPLLSHVLRTSSLHVLLTSSLHVPRTSLLSLHLPPRQYQSQTIAVDMLRNELVQLQQSYDQEKERYSRVSMKMKIKERTKQDLGGITDTMVRELEVYM